VKWYVHRGEAFAFLQQLRDCSIDALITDPPYSSGGQFRGDRTASAKKKYQRADVNEENEQEDFTGDNRDQRGFLAWCTLWLSECFRVLKPGAPVVLFTDWRQLPITTDAMQAGGFVWRGIVPWVKPNPRPRKNGFAQGSEFAVWGSKGALPASIGQFPAMKPWIFSPPRFNERLHLTEKPVELMREAVKVVPIGGTILDPFTGSGATGEAALLEGYSFVGCELSDAYHDVAVERLKRFGS
jgi:site-specific DNA-methyltransferase (adenine-specific)